MSTLPHTSPNIRQVHLVSPLLPFPHNLDHLLRLDQHIHERMTLRLRLE